MGKMLEKEENIRRLAEKFFELPHGSLKAESLGIKFGQGSLINGRNGSESIDPFAAADIRSCDRRLEELRGDK